MSYGRSMDGLSVADAHSADKPNPVLEPARSGSEGRLKNVLPLLGLLRAAPYNAAGLTMRNAQAPYVMASYRGHLTFAGFLGIGYGSLSLLQWHWDWGPALIAAGLTTLGGLLPDLDSDSGVPLRELFGISAAVVPILLFWGVYAACRESTEQTLVVLAAIYLFIRYVLSFIFKHFTVHRGMFHSIPALLIAGLATYLIYPSTDLQLRAFLGIAVMLGFFSHLLLDELYGVDFMGSRLRLHKHAGRPLKFYSNSWPATLTAYLVLALLAWLTWRP